MVGEEYDGMDVEFGCWILNSTMCLKFKLTPFSQASDVPAFLQVETPVSAKFKGAFCEATIKSIKKLVKCKVSLLNCFVLEILYGSKSSCYC